MLAAKQLQLLIGAYIVTCVAAESGDDFSNNLFSDLAPLLALFGERVTMQYMSQSTGWADNIILAMAPLGILTATIAAIRVGGPSWLRAIIGRARETRAAAESELMSSTSNEVCELWNGQEVVRVMGAGPIREFIILSPVAELEETSEGIALQTPTDSTAQTSHAAMRLEDPKNKYFNSYEPTVRDRIFGEGAHEDVEDARLTGIDDPGHPQVIIIRNTASPAPNLTLNVYSHVGRGELYVVAAFGVVLQLAVVVFFGLATYYPKFMFLKDGKPVAGYAFPVTATGTLLVVAGMMMCAYIVEHSTKERLYRPRPGFQAHVVWLQASGTVSDQMFESCAIFPQGPQTLLTTSQREEKKHKLGDLPPWPYLFRRLGDSRARGRTDGGILERLAETDLSEVLTIASTFVTISGFIVQFVGLRAMHWAASISLLGAVSAMTILRVYVRRNLAKLPKSQSLLSGHEMDWLAMTLGSCKRPPWQPGPESEGKQHGRPLNWRVVAIGGGPSHVKQLQAGSAAEDSSAQSLSTDSSSASSASRDGTYTEYSSTQDSGTEGSGTGDSGAEDSRAEDSGAEDSDTKDSYVAQYGSETSQTSSQQKSSLGVAQRVMEIRRNLGELADWHGPASREAIALARAIEVVMSTLFSEKKTDFIFPLAVMQSPIGSEPEPETIHFRVERDENQNWKAQSDQFDAALSLWLYTVHEEESPSDKGDTRTADDPGPSLGSKGDTWLRSKGTPAKRSLRLLGRDNIFLEIDLHWWMPDNAARVIQVKECEPTRDGTPIEVESHRVVGHVSGYTPSFGPRRYKVQEPDTNSHDWTSTVFLRYDSDSESEEDAIFGEDLEHEEDSDSSEYEQHSENGQEEERILAVESYNDLKTLFSQHIFSAFMWAAAKTLDSPMAGPVDVRSTKKDGTSIHSVLQSLTLYNVQLARMAEEVQNTGLGSLEEIYCSIIPPLSSENKLPSRDVVVDWARNHAKRYEQRGQWEQSGEVYQFVFRYASIFPAGDAFGVRATALLMEFLRAITMILDSRRTQHLARADSKLLKEVEQLKEDIQSDLKRLCSPDLLAGLMGLLKIQQRSWEWKLVPQAKSFNKKSPTFDTPGTFKVTRWHGFALGGKIRGRARTSGVNKRDVFDWTPLHYAILSPDDASGSSIIAFLLGRRAEVNAQDLRGRTPLHYACQSPYPRCVQNLMQSGAEISLKDFDGRAPIHYAAMHGQGKAARLLLDAGVDIDQRDGSSKTPWHWAVFKGHKELAEELSKDANTLLRDEDGRTALHLAAIADVDSDRKREEVVRFLLGGAGVNQDAKDRRGRTPLHLAAMGGHTSIVEHLLNAGADVEAMDEKGMRPVHFAAREGHNEVFDHLVTVAGAKKNPLQARGLTPLYLAVKKGHEAVVRILIEAGLDTDTMGVPEAKVLHAAAEVGNLYLVQLLERAGVDMEARGRWGRSLLDAAAGHGNEAIVQYLLSKARGNMEARNPREMTPLHVAARDGKGAVVRYLVSEGANTEAQNDEGKTPLLLAAQYEQEAVVRYLVSEAGANMEARDDRKWTPLHWAVGWGAEGIVWHLVSEGANKEAQDHEGKTPLHLAAQRGTTALARFLVSEGANMEAQDDQKRTPLHWATLWGEETSVRNLVAEGADMEAQDAKKRTPLHLAVLATAKGRNEAVVWLLVSEGANKEAQDYKGRTPLRLAADIGKETLVRYLVSEGANTEALTGHS